LHVAENVFSSKFVAEGNKMHFLSQAVTEEGDVDAKLSIYIVSYVIVSNWIVLQVSVAILLESFNTVSRKFERADAQAILEVKMRSERRNNLLDPLLDRLARKFIDDSDLSTRLSTLFKVLDSDGSGSLSSKEFCDAIGKLDFTPRIDLSDSDFFHLTLNGYSCLTAHETADSKFYALNLQIAFDQFIPQGPSNRT
jgi:hypothetical protein